MNLDAFIQQLQEAAVEEFGAGVNLGDIEIDWIDIDSNGITVILLVEDDHGYKSIQVT